MTEKPVTIVCVGMAGSGKTTFMQRINAHLHAQKSPPYVINLDPAVRSVPFTANIDIRDSVNYKEVMQQYNLGPNGGILTSLNLFATKIDQILGILEKRCGTASTSAPTTSAAGAGAGAGAASTAGTSSANASGATGGKAIKHILVDTPGQIEVFVWSASGAILLDSLASSFPTVIAYVIDTPRSASTSTFMSNMLYACSILYKTKLPMILVCNKTDVQDAGFVEDWMTDFEVFQAALKEEEEKGSFGGWEGGAGGGGGSGYMGSLLNSMSLVLEEFYRHLKVVGVSSMTGQGVEKFFEAVQEKAGEYERDYRPELDARLKERDENKEKKREKELGKLMRDMNVGVDVGGKGGLGEAERRKRAEEGGTLSDMESEDGDGDVGMSDDDEGDDDEDEGEGLQERYKKVLGEEGGAGEGGSSDADHSFARYLKASQMQH